MKDIFGLENKVVVVTGASGGVGMASARLFAEVAKAKVALLARSNLEELVAEISEKGGTATSYSVDISNRDELEAVFNQIESDLGPVHCLLNIAGTCDFYEPGESPISRTKIDEQRWERIVSVNGKGAALAVEFAVRSMPRGGSIVNVASTAGHYGAEFAVIDYTFSKAGLVGMTMGHAKILGPEGIRVNGVAPGPIEGTDMLSAADDDSIELAKSLTKLGKLCQPEDIAKINLFLASDMSGVMTGETVDANCGQFISS